MYRKSVLAALIIVYLVIIAGAVVRMTGSGMGCPDWPKCFGYIIPPTEESELRWESDKEFESGQVIIVDRSLQVAKKDFTTGQSFDPSNWTVYDKHDYAIFNPWHTWIEYINRLLGAIAGLAILFMLGVAVFKERNPKRIVLSLLAVLFIGFQGWLGATVVYSVLSPVRITLHMVMALVIVALLIYMLYEASSEIKDYLFDKKFRNGMLVALFLTLIQIILGTQVRQHVDDQIDIVGYAAKSQWLEDIGLTFYVHRSFSIVVFLLNLWLFRRNRQLNLNHKLMDWVMILLIVEIFTGILMYYLDFPFLTQPAHLIIASVLFGLQFYILLTSFKEKPAVQEKGLA